MHGMIHISYLLREWRVMILASCLRYDIVGLDDRASESCDGIEASVDRVRALLAQERSLGI